MISEDGQTCTVTFDGYGTTEIARMTELMPREWEAPMIPVERERAKTSRLIIACLLFSSIITRQKKDELREIKKKKNEKKVARMQVIEQHREGEKQRWKNFSTKVSYDRRV